MTEDRPRAIYKAAVAAFVGQPVEDVLPAIALLLCSAVADAPPASRERLIAIVVEGVGDLLKSIDIGVPVGRA